MRKINKRQRKKTKKKIEERINFFFGNNYITIGRQCGKTNMIRAIIEIITDKKYKKFKVLKKNK